MNNIFDFVGGDNGQWQVTKIKAVIGNTLEDVPYVKIVPSSTTKSNAGLWTLKGVRSNLRYTEKHEEDELVSIQAGLGRPEAIFCLCWCCEMESELAHQQNYTI